VHKTFSVFSVMLFKHKNYVTCFYVALPEMVEVCRILLQSRSAGSDLGIVWCEDVDFVRKFGALMRLGSSLGSICEQIRINVKFFLILKNYTWLNL